VRLTKGRTHAWLIIGVAVLAALAFILRRWFGVRVTAGNQEPAAMHDVVKPSPQIESLKDHARRLEEVSRENARLVNETPLTKERVDEISRRST